MSQALRERLQQGLRVADDLVYPITGMLDLEDVDELAKLDRPDLKDEAWHSRSRGRRSRTSRPASSSP